MVEKSSGNLMSKRNLAIASALTAGAGLWGLDSKRQRQRDNAIVNSMMDDPNYTKAYAVSSSAARLRKEGHDV